MAVVAVPLARPFRPDLKLGGRVESRWSWGLRPETGRGLESHPRTFHPPTQHWPATSWPHPATPPPVLRRKMPFRASVRAGVQLAALPAGAADSGRGMGGTGGGLEWNG